MSGGVDFRFKKGQRVVKMLYGPGECRSACVGTVASVKKGVVVFEDDKAMTYDARTGRERESLFPGMRSEITPLEEQG